MKKTILMVACALSFGSAWAQELPKWADKARKAVFSIITYNADNKILNTGNGFYIDENGTAVSDYSLFKDAHRAVVVTADGKELPVTLILGANDMYDVVRFRTEVAKKQVALMPSQTPGKSSEQVYVLPYSTQKSANGISGTISKIDTIANNSFYYTLSMQTGDKDVSCPLVNANGEVIGLIQRNSDPESKESYAIGINYAKSLSINALSGNDMTLQSIKIKKGLPEDESQALVFLYMMSSQLDKQEYLGLLNDFINMYPNNMEGYLRRATYYMGENSEATIKNTEADIEQMFKVAEKKEEAHYNYSKLLYNYNVGLEGKKPLSDWTLDKALNEINSAISIAPEGLYYQLQGDIYFAMSKYGEAFTAYEAVCKSPMASAATFYAAAKAKELIEGSEKKEVIALLDSAVAKYPEPYGKDAAPYLFERARVKADAKMYREAVLDYNSFYDAMLGQVAAEFYVIRLQSEMQCRMYQQAINDINKAVELEPSNVSYWVEKGGVHIRVNQLPEAITALEKAISLDPENAGAYRMLGYCQIKDSKTKKAGLENLKKAQEMGDTVAGDLIEKYGK